MAETQIMRGVIVTSKDTANLNPVSPAPNITWALDPQWGHLPIPGNSTVNKTSNEVLRNLFSRMGIEGAHTEGRHQLLVKYAALLGRIHDAAGERAVNEYLEQFKS
jgi:hypothetical protein